MGVTFSEKILPAWVGKAQPSQREHCRYVQKNFAGKMHSANEGPAHQARKPPATNPQPQTPSHKLTGHKLTGHKLTGHKLTGHKSQPSQSLEGKRELPAVRSASSFCIGEQRLVDAVEQLVTPLLGRRADDCHQKVSVEFRPLGYPGSSWLVGAVWRRSWREPKHPAEKPHLTRRPRRHHRWFPRGPPGCPRPDR